MRNEDMERRCLQWARWRAGQSRGALGYAAVQLGERVDGAGWDAQAAIPTMAAEAIATDEAIRALVPDLQRTLQVHYLGSGGIESQARTLGVGVRSVHERIARAHRLMAAWFAERAALAREQRARVEALQASARPRHVDIAPPPGAGARRVRARQPVK